VSTPKSNVPSNVMKNKHVQVTTTELNQRNMKEIVKSAINLKQVKVAEAENGNFIKILKLSRW
jgi:hypothetical protein